MHTDEYEISIAREINVCLGAIKKIEAKLDRWRQKAGIDFVEARKALATSAPVLSEKEMLFWGKEIEALSIWQQRLDEYRGALAAMRISASPTN